MPTARPFAYNTGSQIAGTTQVGNLAVGYPTSGFAATGLQWWNGPDEELGYVIAQSVPSNTQPTPIPGVSASVGFFRSSALTESSFIQTAQIVSGGQIFASGTAAKTWLNNNGYWTSYGPSIVTTGLAFNLQSAPSSGTTWTDASGNGYNATLNGTTSYVSNNSGGIKLANSTYTGDAYISVPYNFTGNTVSVEIVASFNPTSYWATIWANEIYNSNSGYFAYMGGSTSINYGRPTSTTSITLTASNSIRHWVFVINNTNSRVYLNGTQTGTTASIVAQTIFPTNNLYFGARHTNVGTGATDKLNSSTLANQPVFYQMRVYNIALSQAEVTQNFNAIKDTYGL